MKIRINKLHNDKTGLVFGLTKGIDISHDSIKNHSLAVNPSGKQQNVQEVLSYDFNKNSLVTIEVIDKKLRFIYKDVECATADLEDVE